MNPLLRALSRPISTSRTDSTVASMALYFGSALVMVLGAFAIGSIEGTKIELLIAVLGLVILSLVLVLFGILLEIQQSLRDPSRESTESNP